MHLVIANQIAEKLAITDKTSFLIGGIAPDAVAPKDLSHFYTGEVSDYSRSIDFQGLLHKYSALIHTDFVLGYYSHLIADDIWLKGFYLPWLKNRMEANPAILSQYHHDFYLLNGKLLNYYGINSEVLEDWEKKSFIFDLQEVTTADLREFVPYVIGDMEYTEAEIKENLSVFTFDQIVGYIETSIHKGILHMKEVFLVRNRQL